MTEQLQQDDIAAARRRGVRIDVGPFPCPPTAEPGILGGKDAALALVGTFWRLLHAGDVGGEEVDAVAVEVATCAVVVLGGTRVGVPGEDLGVAERDSGIEGVGDRGVA